MSELCQYALQEALYTVLTGDADLMQQVTDVFDYVPPETAYPYVTLGEMRATDVSSVTNKLTRLEVVLHVYSRNRGRKETGEIMARISVLLDEQEPLMNGFTAISLRYSGSDISQERDGLTYHGRMKFDALVQQN